MLGIRCRDRERPPLRSSSHRSPVRDRRGALRERARNHRSHRRPSHRRGGEGGRHGPSVRRRPRRRHRTPSRRGARARVQRTRLPRRTSPRGPLHAHRRALEGRRRSRGRATRRERPRPSVIERGALGRRPPVDPVDGAPVDGAGLDRASLDRDGTARATALSIDIDIDVWRRSERTPHAPSAARRRTFIGARRSAPSLVAATQRRLKRRARRNGLDVSGQSRSSEPLISWEREGDPTWKAQRRLRCRSGTHEHREVDASRQASATCPSSTYHSMKT